MSEIVKITNLTKFFPGIKALDNVELTLKTGEIHALIGENGAGKSTLVKILTGVYQPTSGVVELRGKEVYFHNAIEAQHAGIVAIHQEASMFPELSVTENIYMGHHLRNPRTHLLDWKKMKEETRMLLKKMNLDINPETLVKNLSTAQRHMVEVTKALSMKADVIIFDEPTSALTNNEVEELYRIIRDLKKEGKSIVFISHKFEEIFQICDTFTVLRDGQFIGNGTIAGTTQEKIINMMIGRDLATLYPKRKNFKKDNPVVLSVHGLSQTGAFQDVSFDLHAGEILGFYGLVGAGRTEVVRTIFGYDMPSAGTMTLNGKTFSPRHPEDALAAGIAMVPEDRQKQGLILQMSISHNITLPQIGKLSKKGFWTDGKAEKDYTVTHGENMEIKAAGWHVDADTLSGGNQQKVVLAKWLGTDPSILILDEPTKGIDVQTKAAVHEFMVEMADKGKAVIIVSSEMPEVLGMSDTLVVLHEGEITAVLEKAEATQENVVRAAIGEKIGVGRLGK